MEKISSLGIPMLPQEISKKYKRQIIGMPKVSPSSSTKHQVISRGTIFLSLHKLCVVLGASVVFVFSLVQFACCSIWLYPSNTCSGGRHALFSCLEHSSFHSRCSVSVHFCQYCVQLLFFILMLFRASLVFYLVYLVVRFFVVRSQDSLRKFLLETCFK